MAQLPATVSPWLEDDHNTLNAPTMSSASASRNLQAKVPSLAYLQGLANLEVKAASLLLDTSQNPRRLASNTARPCAVQAPYRTFWQRTL